jgi:uncharacterized protein (DUF58 family)
MITARGIFWFFLILLVWAVLAYSGIAQLQIVLFVLVILPLLSLGMLISQRSRLRITQTLSSPVIQRDETTFLQIRLQLRGWQLIGLASLLVEKTGKDDKPVDECRYVVLQPRDETVVSVQLRGHHRGLARVGLKRLLCRDLFGLFRLSFHSCRRSQLESMLIVLPRPFAFDPLHHLSTLLQDKQQMKSWKPGSDLDAIANIRQQRPGDALKRAHWKLTARLDELMIREFENPLQQEVVVLCDLDRHAARNLSWNQFGDYFTDSSAWLIRTILNAGCAVRLIAWQKDGRTEARAGSPAAEQAVMMRLAELDDGSNWAADQLVAEEATRYPDVRVFILVTDRLNEATAQKMAQCALNGLETWLILLQGAELLPGNQHPLMAPMLTAGVTVCRADFTTWRAARKNLPGERDATAGQTSARQLRQERRADKRKNAKQDTDRDQGEAV